MWLKYYNKLFHRIRTETDISSLLFILKKIEFLKSDYHLLCHLKKGITYRATVYFSVALWINILHGYTFLHIGMTGISN